jgi:nitrite reductase/ring-hydroxylating ferredoxin subunit
MTPPESAPATSDEQAFQQLAEEVDRAIADAGRLDGAARETALRLKAALERFHKVGLSKIVARLRADAHGKALLFDLVDEPEVRALLSLHELIRMPRSEHPAPALPLAPPPPTPPPISAVIPLAALKAPAKPGWTAGPTLAEIGEDRPYRLDIGDASVVLVRVGDHVQAFRNECAHQGLPIDGGLIDRESRTITCPWHGFRFDCATGECLTAPHVQLERLPMRIEGGVVHVQVG